MATFGLTIQGGSSNDIGSGFAITQEDATDVTAGTLDDVQMYVRAVSSSQLVKGLIYEAGAGSVALVANTADITITTTAGFFSGTLSGEAVAASTTYKVGMANHSSGSITIYYDSVAGNRYVGTMGATPPNPWNPSVGLITGRVYTFFANYTEDAAGLVVNATTDTLSIADFNTTVEALVNLNVSATSDSLTITDFNTTVTALVDLSVSATLDTLSITNFNTVVLANTDISATLDTLTITDFNTTVEALVDLNIAATLDGLSITDFNTTVTAGQDTSITATLDTLTITNFDTTVTALVDINITASLDTLSITDFNAIIQVGNDTNINATVDNLLITDFNTTVQALVSQVINATTDNLTISNFNAVIVSGAPVVVTASIIFAANIDTRQTGNIETIFTANINDNIISANLNED